MIACKHCYGNEIEEHLWVDVVTGDAVSRDDEYFCRSCGCRTDIIVTADPEIWVEDVEPIKEENEGSIINVSNSSRTNPGGIDSETE